MPNAAPDYELGLTPSGAPRFIFDSTGPDWEQWLLFTSDVHFDSQHCQRDALFSVLDQAVARDALWIDLGDFFDAMQSKSDKRRELDGIRPEYLYPSDENKRMGLWQRIVSDCEEKLQGYADRLIMTSLGNHETAALRWSDINLSQELANIARRSGSRQCHNFGYTGYAHVACRIFTRNQNRPSTSFSMFLTHGTGGSSPVTLGASGGQRRMVYAPDARLYISGHTHQETMMTRSAVRSRPPSFVERIEERHDVVIPGFKAEFSVEKGPRKGWALERGFAPTAIGGLWVRLYLKSAPAKNLPNKGNKQLFYELSWAKP